MPWGCGFAKVSLLQIQGIGVNIVPVFYAVTRPASINFLFFLAIIVSLGQLGHLGKVVCDQ